MESNATCEPYLKLKLTYKIFRAIVLTAIVMAIVLPAMIYVALSLPFVQNIIKEKCEEVLSEKLGAEVEIGNLDIFPFNRLSLQDVSLSVDNEKVLSVGRMGASVNLYALLIDRKIVVNYAAVIDLDARIWRETADAPLNIQPVIDALKSKDKNKPPTKFDLCINSIVVRHASVSYDILSAEAPEADRFDPNHIAVNNLNADIHLRQLSDSNINAEIRRLAFEERSGLRLSDLTGHFMADKETVEWQNVGISIGDHTLFNPADGFFNLPLTLQPVGLRILPGSTVYPPDIASIVPELGSLDETFALALNARYYSELIEVEEFDLTSTSGLPWQINISEASLANPFDLKQFDLAAPSISFSIDDRIFDKVPGIKHQISNLDRLPGRLKFDASAELNPLNGNLRAVAEVDRGIVEAHLEYHRSSINAPFNVASEIDINQLDINTLLRSRDFGPLNLAMTVNAIVGKGLLEADISGNIVDFVYKDFNYNAIDVEASYDDKVFEVQIEVDRGNLLSLLAEGSLREGERKVNAAITVDNFNPKSMGLSSTMPSYSFGGKVVADLEFDKIQPFYGGLTVNDFSMRNEAGKTISVDKLSLTCDEENIILLQSDFINGRIDGSRGDIVPETLVAEIKDIVMQAVPALYTPDEHENEAERRNDFNFAFMVEEPAGLTDFFGTPIKLYSPLEISGGMNAQDRNAHLSLNLPFVGLNSKKFIEDARLRFTADYGLDSLCVSLKMPLRQDVVAFNVGLRLFADTYNLDVDWDDISDLEKIFRGNVDFSGMIYRTDDNQPAATMAIESRSMVLNDARWEIETGAPFILTKDVITVNNLNIFRSDGDEQYAKIDGIISQSLDDKLTVDIKNFSLDYLFNTLHIDKAMLGGVATGKVTGAALLSRTPSITTDQEGINVENVSFNGCLFGNANVTSKFDMEKKEIEILGNIDQTNGKRSNLICNIYPFNDSISIDINANRAPLGFLSKYMEAFASDVGGEGTGNALVYGTFHDMDVKGRVSFENFNLKLDFTNTRYYATDSLTIEPGNIIFNNILMRDTEGHTARLNGRVMHTYFNDPRLEINITDARNFLVYNAPETPGEYWYGKIYVDGKAAVTNNDPKMPGAIKISADVRTAPGSTFTYILSDDEVAEEYTFITFRDKATLLQAEEELADDRPVPTETLRQMFLNSNQNQDEESPFELDFTVAITPEAEVDLIMDPKAGDKIRSHGSGNMRIVYHSADDNLELYGDYRLDSGSYNFTLQDIIIKDFIIENGSSISFPNGDPYATMLDIKAYYELTANLSDLDDSFLQDRELNRTNIRVRSVLHVTGSIEQPELKLDLEFPTLTEETVRKIRSIISTEEMLNRQIIYLLALSRFYTPDYMSATKGNELVSLASSTLSSQLSNVLRQLTDVVAISPSLRSSKGDFSDMEFDVALSSALLNNRLLLNGNFGYRDKTLNTNQFIGDFDLEYLLNRQGTIRVKAYNRFNDQNYYLRTAETTQGVGVSFKTDFDDLPSLFRSLFRRRKSPNKKDTIAPTPVPSLSTESTPTMNPSPSISSDN